MEIKEQVRRDDDYIRHQLAALEDDDEVEGTGVPAAAASVRSIPTVGSGPYLYDESHWAYRGMTTSDDEKEALRVRDEGRRGKRRHRTAAMGPASVTSGYSSSLPQGPSTSFSISDLVKLAAPVSDDENEEGEEGEY